MSLPNYLDPQHAYDARKIKSHLSSQDWPQGLIEEYISDLKTSPVRYFIIDDSGSMLIQDSVRIITHQDGSFEQIVTSRWEELKDTIRFHAELGTVSNSTTHFRLLNHKDVITIDNSLGDNGANGLVQLLQVLDQVQPKYMTPLCRHIESIIKSIREIEPFLRKVGIKAKIVIATDGEATDGNLAEVMKPLRTLPVWIVIRLCSSNTKVSEYWARIDEELELSLDVVQCQTLEAEEIYPLNPWLTYSTALHRLRENGISFREIDFLDERRLSAEQVWTFCKYMCVQ
jgi:hypothetical protein